jgi:phosphoadenosine phosphosulfate reductase
VPKVQKEKDEIIFNAIIENGKREANIFTPIYDWTDEDILNFISEKQIQLAPAYSLGLKRLGCVGCPLVNRKGAREKEFELYPKYYEAIKRAITKE